MFAEKFFILETILQMDRQFFAMGKVIDLHQPFNDKPLKAMILDPNTKIPSLRIESKKKN